MILLDKSNLIISKAVLVIELYCRREQKVALIDALDGFQTFHIRPLTQLDDVRMQQNLKDASYVCENTGKSVYFESHRKGRGKKVEERF
ncbi:hypothetical protein AVEN_193596-1 [Araneus ventricosus]|uniref:Uncharacterized protein n=1 Tax=Araneus ventricosus TaxID=182803 RepID=A0A4Y2VHY3_ARAVE|nr:hypothetical protein AVEN_189975-1 [Araneus ventricosus]GBO24911.1 hypothetical protein AVEN_193596-1 [Araneus ventricosus]